MSASTNSVNQRQLVAWLILVVAVAAVAMLIAGVGVAEGQGDNQPPPGPAVSDQSATIGQAFSYTFDAVADPDAGQTVAYTATLGDDSALPTWLSFDANTRTFAGTPPTEAADLTVKVTATDSGEPPQSASATFTITVSAAAIQPCIYTSLTLNQGRDTTPGDRVDLILELTGASGSCTLPTGDIRITLPREMTVPRNIDPKNVVIGAGGRYHPGYVDVDLSDTADQPHRITLPGCGGNWHATYDERERPECPELRSSRVSISLDNVLRLPAEPPDSDDGYPITVSWGESGNLTDKLGVNAALEIEGENEVGYGETITFTGSGFEPGLSVNLYAQPSTGSAACTSVGGNGWRDVGSTTVGSDYRFTTQVEIRTTVFPNAGRYQVCARDGSGRTSGTSTAIDVKAGLRVVGADSSVTFRPGEEVNLSIEGATDELRVNNVLVAGRSQGAQWRQTGKTLTVTIPPGTSGTVTVHVTFDGGQTASVNITIAAIELLVQGIGSDGLTLGQTAIASSFNLPGNEVCNITLGGVRLAFVDDNEVTDECVRLSRGGRLSGTFAVASPQGNVSFELISRFLSSDGAETLQVTDNTGARASAEVKIAKPTITFTPADGEVALRDIITIRGANFPPERNYYNPPTISVTIDGRPTIVYATGTSWELQYEVTRRQQAGSVLTVQVKIDGYPLNQLTASYRIRVAAGALSVTPPDLGIGEPITVMVSSLEAYTAGYSVRLSNGPVLRFNGSATFQTDRVGKFTGQSMIPVDYHEDFATTAGYTATIYVYNSARDRVPGVFATVTLNKARYVAPTPTPTITPTPTNTPIPTNTPLPTDTPIPPTDTPIPPTSTPIPPTHTPVPPPTDTPVPPPTVDRTAIVQTVTAAVISSDDDRTVVDRPVSTPESSDGGLSTFAIVLLVAVGVILLVIVALVAALVAMRSRRVGPEQPPFDELPSI